ncbi:MAG: anti-sigma factor [Actinomycetota bacterium]
MTETMKNKKRLAGVVLAAALVAAACGSDGDSEATEAADQAATGAATDSSDGDAMADDEDAMEDDAMEDDEDAMADDEDAMEDDAMADDEDAMEDDAMEDDAMADGRPILNISFSGLEPLGDDFEYEVWTIVDGAPVTGGIFDIDDDGAVEITSDQDHLYGHDGATAVVISIEPAIDDDPAPADTKVLGGEIAADGGFDLTIDHPAALGTDFADAAGSFILGTPTDDPEGNELSGVWFLSVPGPETSLDLPELPAGWVYEGWAVIDDQPISTGRFTDPAAADDFDGFSGPNPGPNYPGEDFLVNAPDGLTFPTDLTGSTVVISVEPDADNSPAPFALKPLVAVVADGVSDHQNIDLETGSVAISGSGSVEG